MYASGLTDTGVTRSQNQDSIFVSLRSVGPLPNLFIVADGVGGHKAGDIASKIAVEYVAGYIFNYPMAPFVQPADYLDLLLSAVQEANLVIKDFANENKEEMEGMGTTFTACVVEEKKLYIAHIGDSRAYKITNDKIEQITIDHTYVQKLVSLGQITAEEAKVHPKRNVITHALGMDLQSQLDGYVIPHEGKFSILVCSDGLTDMLDDAEIKEIISGDLNIHERTQLLINEANYRGGLDNISAIIIDVGR